MLLDSDNKIVNPHLLRDKLSSIFKNNRFYEFLLDYYGDGRCEVPYPRNIDDLPASLPYAYSYDLTTKLAYLCADTYYGKTILNPPLGGNEKLDNGDGLCKKLMLMDTSRIIAPVAAITWLTLDDYRLHTDPALKEVWPNLEEDYSYGLVLQYPDYVLCYVMFLLKYRRKEYLKTMRKDLVKKYYDAAERYRQEFAKSRNLPTL